jgi:RNA polymerase primary sigma factor
MTDDSETSIKIYLREIRQTLLLTPQEETELAARIKKGDQKARAWMIKANLRLVVKIARDYSNLGLPLLDLISEGNIGLMKAVERFDPAKGGKLSTYGAWWIKQSIKRAMANQSKTIRLPVHLIDKIYKLNRASLKMSEELGREPTDEELSEEIGISSAKLSQLKTVSIRPASLDAPIGDDDSTEFGEIVGDKDAQTPFELFRDKNMRDELSELLKVLDDRERKIIFDRFGLDGGKPKTLEEVGKKFGVTRERIRQLQNIALAKLRRALAKREKPIVRLDPDQFLTPVSPDPTRTRLGAAKATIPPKATLDSFVSAGQVVLHADSTPSVVSSPSV